VIPGNTYWIQVDGSGGGLENSFYIHLYEMTTSGTADIEENKLQVYPQPASDYVFIAGKDLLKIARLRLEVYNSSGSLILKENPETDQETIRIDVSGWNPGVYFARITAGNVVYPVRIVKH
jgi:hypothetical protein